MSGEELKATLIGSLKERILDAELDTQVQIHRATYIEELCKEGSSQSHLDRLEYFRKGIKLCERVTESIRDSYESLLVGLVQGRLSPDYVKEVLSRRDNFTMKSVERMKTLLDEQREAKRKRFRIVKSDD
jgi:hypothetical protein